MKINEDQSTGENSPKTDEAPKNQWWWLIGLCLAGGASMYILAKLTRMLGVWAGLG